MLKNKNKILILSVSLICSALYSQSVDSDSNEDMNSLMEDVIVTANKRKEALSDVAASTNVISASVLEELDISMADELTLFVPSLSSDGEGGRGGARSLYVRGVSDGGNGNLGTIGPSSAQYFDGMPVTSTQSAPDIHLYDMARVEVLNGPQGTLYGSRSQSGVIKYVTKDVNMNERETFVDLGYEDISQGENNVTLETALNIPFKSGRGGLRFVAYDLSYGGYVDNVLGTRTWTVSAAENNYIVLDNSKTVQEDWNTADTDGFRLKFKHLVGDNGIFTFNHLTQSDKRKGNVWLDPSKGDYETVFWDRGYGDEEINLNNITFEHSFNSFDVVYNYGEYSRAYQNAFDWTTPPSSNIAIATCSYDMNGPFRSQWSNFRDCGDPSYTFETDGEWDRSSHEIRVVSTSEGPLQYIFGYYDETLDLTYDLNGLTDPIDGVKDENLKPGNKEGGVWQSENDRKDTVSAFFGEVEYSFGDFAIKYGRREYDVATDIYITTYPTAVWYYTSSAPFDTDYHSSESDNLQKISLTYRMNDNVLWWITNSEGYRPGGPNRSSAPGIPVQYASDFLTNKEIGFKATKLMDGKLNFNGTYSVMDWEEFQTTTWDGDISAFSFTGNIGSAEIKGLEMNAYYSATDSLFFYLGVAKYDSSIESDYSIGQYSVVPAGTPLPRTPDMKSTLYANYSFSYGSFDADASLSVVKVGSANTTLFPGTNYVTKGYTYPTFKLSLEKGNVTYGLSIKNLSDTESEITRTGREAYILSQAPRRIGLSASYRF
ncbi:MAG: TonB-dependent receptor [Gammaproteobacteria bacterium]|tara:strand:+ start:152 stop:2464 length:2313 start_codon:yes stop_codon:yes gene_type:complete